jgi:tRNA-dihydrouridine synthase A
MMDWTDRHCRMFHRALSKRARLYTEMVTANAVIHGERDRLIGFNTDEQSVALQLGGSDPAAMAEAARIAQDFGYEEVNINCGCPSDRVQSGFFGACLMREPQLVAACYKAMASAVDIPVTVKCRLGVDDDDEQTSLFNFVDTIAEAGCTVFMVHARKAWLKGLSPKENRDIPPLNYDLVAKLKAARPELTITLNGGLATLEDCQREMPRFDGVMLGRAAYQTPALLGHVDHALFDEGDLIDVYTALETYRPYMLRQLESGVNLHAITRHMLGLFAGRPGARAYRRHISENATKPGAGITIFDDAVGLVRQAELKITA